MQITLSADLAALVQKHILSGNFDTAEDVVRCALESWEAESNSWTDEDRSALEVQIAEGLAQFAAGKGISPEELDRRIDVVREKRFVSR